MTRHLHAVPEEAEAPPLESCLAPVHRPCLADEAGVCTVHGSRMVNRHPVFGPFMGCRTMAVLRDLRAERARQHAAGKPAPHPELLALRGLTTRAEKLTLAAFLVASIEAEDEAVGRR